MKTSFMLIISCLLLAPATAGTAPTITGPVAAKVVKVYDGDTITVEAYPLPGITANTKVRVNGVDTLEIRGKCKAEKR